MGGVVILTAILGSTLLWANLVNRYVWVAMLAVTGFGLIGMWDDWLKIRKRRGLSARVKFLLQAVLTLLLLQIVFWQPRADWQGAGIPSSREAVNWLLWFRSAMLVLVVAPSREPHDGSRPRHRPHRVAAAPSGSSLHHRNFRRPTT